MNKLIKWIRDIAIIIVGVIAFFVGALMIGNYQYEHSPIDTNTGRHVGAGYECKDNVLYHVEGSGNAQMMSPAFDAKTSKIRTCVNVR